MKKLETFTVNPNAVYMLPPEPIDENDTINLSQEILPRCPDIRIESKKLVRFSGENEFSLKIGGTTYEVNTHFSKKGGKMSQTTNSVQRNVPEQRTYKVEDIAAMLNIGRTSAYSLAKEGHFKIVRVGNAIRVSKKSFDEWLDAQTF